MITPLRTDRMTTKCKSLVAILTAKLAYIVQFSRYTVYNSVIAGILPVLGVRCFPGEYSDGNMSRGNVSDTVHLGIASYEAD